MHYSVLFFLLENTFEKPRPDYLKMAQEFETQGFGVGQIKCSVEDLWAVLMSMYQGSSERM